MTATIRFARSVDGVRIAFATSGGGRPLVRVAHWFTHLDSDWDSPVWGHWLRELSRRHTLVRYDGRGTGLSDRSVERFSLEAWVRDLEAVVGALGLERFALLGICQGAATATAFAARHPERVTGMALVEPYPRGAYAAGATTQERRQAHALGEMIAVGWGEESGAFRELFANLLIPGATREQQRWLAQMQRRSSTPETAARLWRAFHELDVREVGARVRVPTTVFHVRGDAMVPFELGRGMAALIPGARLVPLEGRNHILLEGDPGWSVFCEAVEELLAETRARVPTSSTREELSRLTPREREVLTLIGEGLSNDEIAERLFVAVKTVRNHASRIYGKLGVTSRARAVVVARRLRW